MTIQNHCSYRVIEFPDPPQPPNDKPAMVRPLVDGEPFLGDAAVGEVRVDISDDLMIEIVEHVPGQVQSLLSRLDQGTIQRVDIHSGAISAADLSVIAKASVLDVRLGKRRVELGPPEPIEMVFTDGPNLSKLSGPNYLDVLNVPFTNTSLSTVGSTSLDGLHLAGMSVELSRLKRFKFLRLLHFEGGASGHDLSFLSSMPNLSLFGFRLSGLTADQLTHLKNCPQLKILDIAYNRDLGPDLSVLDGYPALTYLGISGTRTDDSTLASIANLRFLKTLEAQCVGITDDGLDALRSMPDLTTLNLAGNRISDAGLRTIVDALPRLKTLDIRATDVTPEGARVLSDLKDLWRLGLSDPLLTVDFTTHMRYEGSVTELIVGMGMFEMNEEQAAAFEVIECGQFPGRPI